MRLASNVGFFLGVGLTLTAVSCLGMASTEPTPEPTVTEVIVVPEVESIPTEPIPVEPAPVIGTTTETTVEPVIIPADPPKVKDRESLPPATVVESIQTPDLPTYTLPPCEQEDSQNCYWDAATMGNGIGTSFINLNGVYYYAEG